MCININGKPACLILQVLKAADMIITTRNAIEWTVSYMQKYGSAVGQELYYTTFEADIMGLIVRYLENWSPKWEPSGPEE